MANMAKPLGGSYHHVSPVAQRRIDLGQFLKGIVAETESVELLFEIILIYPLVH